jgi:thioredoxin-related protein
MKKLVLIVTISVAFSATLTAQKKGLDLNWQSNFEVAKKMATQHEKMILIYFTGSDWSSACKNLNKDFFYTEKFKTIAAANLILVRIDSPRRPNLISELQASYNTKLSKKYGQKVYPTMILANANGDELGKIESYNYLHDTSKHYALIANALKEKSKK